MSSYGETGTAETPGEAERVVLTAADVTLIRSGRGLVELDANASPAVLPPAGWAAR